MNIIYAPTTGALTARYAIGMISLTDNFLSVTLTAHSLEENVQPGGAMALSTWNQNVVVPKDVLLNHPDTETAVAMALISSEGPFPGGILVSDDDLEFQTLKQSLLHKVKVLRNEKLFGVAMTDFGPVEVDGDSIALLNLNLKAADLLGEAFSVTWTRADNEDVTLNAAQLMSVATSIWQYTNAVQQKKRNLTAEINAIDIEDVDSLAALGAVDINAGWPV